MEWIKAFLRRFAKAFTMERVICRLVAAWCSVTAWTLLTADGFHELEYAQNTSLGYVLVCTALFFAIYSCLNVVAKGYPSDTWFLMASATVCVAQWLLSYEYSKKAFLFTLAVIVAYSFFVVYFVRKNGRLWKVWQPGGKTVWTVAIACGVFSGFVIAAITCYRHLCFGAPNFDFGLFVNMFHNMKEKGLPLCTSERDVLLSHFAIHISPIYYLLLPFYMLFPSPLTLQIGQAVVLASGVIPVTLLCRHFKLSGKCTILVALIYSLFPALSTGCFYDIHENCFLTPLLLWMFCFLERREFGLMYIFALLTLMVKEDAAIYVILFSLYVFFGKKDFVRGFALLFGALAYFAGALMVLEKTSAYYTAFYAGDTPNPSINGPMIDRFDNLILNKEDGLVGAIKTALVNPGFLLTQLFTTGDGSWNKFQYFFQMFLPLAFLPLCTNKPARWLLAAPILMNLLTNYQYQYQIGFQYHFGITAFLFYGAIVNLPGLSRPTRRNLMSFAAAACCCLYLTFVMPTFSYYRDRWEVGKEQYTKMEQILDTVPKDASVSCSTYLLSHLADRDEIYEIGYHGNEADVDYVIFDARYAVSQTQINAYLDQGYVVQEEHKGMVLILAKEK